MARGVKFLEGADIRHMIRKWQDNLSYETQGLVCFNCERWNWAKEDEYGFKICTNCGDVDSLGKISELIAELTKRKEAQDAARALEMSKLPADWKMGNYYYGTSPNINDLWYQLFKNPYNNY